MMENLKVFEQALPNGGKLVIFRAEQKISRECMDQRVSEYLKEQQSYSEFTWKREDDGLIRVVVIGINEIPFKPL